MDNLIKRIKNFKYVYMPKHPPKSLQGYLWSVDVNNLDIKEDRVYIINQILSYGDTLAMKWLFQNYGSSEVVDIFLKHPIKDYRKARFYFIKNFILLLNNKQLDERRYVKNTPRLIIRKRLSEV